MRATLTYYWRTHLAVILGAAVATAVLTGALLVGDSVRGSLRQLTLERLGKVDHALAGQRFFPQHVADALTEDAAAAEQIEALAPVILLRGSAQHTTSRARASDVGLQGITEQALALFDEGPGKPAALFAERQRTPFPPVAINRALAAELGAAVGDDVLLSLKRWSEVPTGSLLGQKSVGDVIQTLRLRVVEIVADSGMGRFALETHQGTTRNVFIPLDRLQKALAEEGSVNGVLVEATETDDANRQSSILAESLRAQLHLADLGVLVEPRGDVIAIESEEFILGPSLVEAIGEVAGDAAVLPIYTYLANGLAVGDRSIAYSTVTAMPTRPPAEFGELRLVDGTPAPELDEDEILLNAWAAEELEAVVGDLIRLDYFVVGPREDLREESHQLRLAGIVALESLAADPRLSQEYPGIAGAADMSDWDPPFPLDLGLVTERDEEYWDLYRGSPKAFVALSTGQQMWRNRWGQLTALRLAPTDGDRDALVGRLEQELPALLPPESLGLAFQPVKALGLAAASGATDFGGLFVGFSLFLIVAAAMLAALLFGLGVEQRAAEIGLLEAVGWTVGRVRRQLLAEGLLLATVGGLLGLAGAVAYAALMMAALRTWWRPAMGTSALYLHVSQTSLAIGFVASLAVVGLSIWWTIRRFGKIPTTRLLKRVVEPPASRTPGRTARGLALLTVLALALLGWAAVSGNAENPAIFFTAGPLLLIGLLALYSLWTGRARRRWDKVALRSLVGMAAANSGRQRGRGLLSASLLAAASFLIVTVASMQHDYSREDLGSSSGTGGFGLVAESDVPLHHDLDSADGRFELGLPDAAEQRLAGVEVTPLRLLPGDDTSCLNLYQPGQPRLLGVPDSLIDRGAFTFTRQAVETDNPWALLQQDLGEGVIPAIGDFESLSYILKVGLNETLELEDEFGQPLRLQIVGMLATSIFQSELLVSEENLLRHFPSRDGFSYFLVDAPSERRQDVAEALEVYLEPYGFDATGAADKLDAFHAVRNTFLQTFQTLGGLGLLLGTIGLAVVLVRSLIERRGELATLRAFGFRRARLTLLVLLENAVPLVGGLAIGTIAALVTAAPFLLSDGSAVPWQSIALTLAGVLAFGLLAATIAAKGALRADLLPALKAEQ